MKKQLSILLAIIMLFMVLTPTALAANFEIKTIVTPKYEDAQAFSDGIAAVKSGGKWGYIDEDGKTVIPFQYDYAGRFSEGVAVAGYYGEETVGYGSEEPYLSSYYSMYLLDKDGNETQLMYSVNDEDLSPQLYYCSDYNEAIESAGADWFCQGGVINVNGTPYDIKGNQIFPNGTLAEDWDFYAMTGPCVGGIIPMCAYWPTEVGSQCFFMDKNGNITRQFPAVTDANPSGITRAYAPDRDRIVAYVGTFGSDTLEWSGAWGAMDLSGNWIIQPKYAGFRYMLSGRMFCDGVWTVYDANNKYGGVDVNGKVVVPLQYDFMSSFTEGMCAVKKNGGFYYIDLTGKAYSIGDLTGEAAASVSAASFFNGGVSPVYIASDGSAYCIQNVPKSSILPAIEGTGNIGHNVYFPDFQEDTDDLTLISSLGDIAVIKENEKFGFARLTFTLDLPDENAMDTWAYDEVCKAIEADLIPNSLQNQYRSNITRGEFALLMTEVATAITGKDLDTLVKDVSGKDLDDIVAAYPFTDTTARNIIAANALGIINGYGNGIFKPDATIMRQDAAAMLLRSAVAIKADALDGWDDKISQANIQFSDGGAFSSYAKEAIGIMASLDVMKGIGNNQFAPTATYTRQQSYMTAYRLMVQILDNAG